MASGRSAVEGGSLVKRLLVVENDEHLVRLVVEAASTRGWEACSRSRFESRDPLIDWADVLLVGEDVVSPGGYLSLRALETGERRVPMVLLVDEVVRGAVRSPGAPVVVGKPFVISELLDALDQARDEVVDLTADDSVVDVREPVLDLTAEAQGRAPSGSSRVHF